MKARRHRLSTWGSGESPSLRTPQRRQTNRVVPESKNNRGSARRWRGADAGASRTTMMNVHTARGKKRRTAQPRRWGRGGGGGELVFFSVYNTETHRPSWVPSLPSFFSLLSPSLSARALAIVVAVARAACLPKRRRRRRRSRQQAVVWRGGEGVGRKRGSEGENPRRENEEPRKQVLKQTQTHIHACTSRDRAPTQRERVRSRVASRSTSTEKLVGVTRQPPCTRGQKRDAAPRRAAAASHAVAPPPRQTWS